MGCFSDARYGDLKRRPLEQIWRDHLLVGAHEMVDGFDDAIFVFLYPAGNSACVNAVADYRGCLTREESFCPWTLEKVVEALRSHTDAQWVEHFFARYLDFGLFETLEGW